MNALDQLRAARQSRTGKARCGHDPEVIVVLGIRERGANKQTGRHLSSKAVTVCAECALTAMTEFEQRWKKRAA